MARLELSRLQILSFRRRAGSLNERLPMGTKSLRLAAWAGLQDSMPRAAVLSVHARVAGTSPAHWEHPSLVQLWGPRFSNYVVAAKDVPVFTLGRLPDDVRRRARAHDTAARLHTFLEGRRMPFGKAGHAMGVQPNSLRYAAQTGTVLLRWDGAKQPVVWTAPTPDVEPRQARLELARRYLHIFGPATAGAFAKWAGIRPEEARSAIEALAEELTPVGRRLVTPGFWPTTKRPFAVSPSRLCLLGCYRAAMRTSYFGALIENCWCPTPSGEPNYGRLVSGRAHCW